MVQKYQFNKRISINNRQIGVNCAPFVVAEMSGNHNQSLENALKIIEAARNSGADAIKLQTYTADTMTLNLKKEGFHIRDEKSLWNGKTLYDLYREAHTPWEWHQTIFKRSEELGLFCFSTPFDLTAVDFLESLNAPAYKIASFEITDIPLITKVASTGKPVIISTGMAELPEVYDAVEAVGNAGCRDLILLKCTSSYPADPADSNLLTIPDLKAHFDCQVGLSDHTLGVEVALGATALGATFIEKHFTLCRQDGGVDSAFSLEPDEFRALKQGTFQVWKSLGKVQYGPTQAEQNSLIFRRSLYIVKSMKIGEVFTRDNLRSIRPGFGLPPKHFYSILGKKITRDTSPGTPLSWDLIAGYGQ